MAEGPPSATTPTIPFAGGVIVVVDSREPMAKMLKPLPMLIIVAAAAPIVVGGDGVVATYGEELIAGGIMLHRRCCFDARRLVALLRERTALMMTTVGIAIEHIVSTASRRVFLDDDPFAGHFFGELTH